MAGSGDYYATLKVRPNVDADSLRLAYRDLMRLHHPDVNSSEEAVETCKAINEAYACLRDPRRRASYDARRRAHQRARRAAFSPSPQAYRPQGWHPQFIDEVDFQEGLDTRRSRIMRVVGAILVTIVAFAATSYIELPGQGMEKGAPVETEAPSRP